MAVILSLEIVLPVNFPLIMQAELETKTVGKISQDVVLLRKLRWVGLQLDIAFVSHQSLALGQKTGCERIQEGLQILSEHYFLPQLNLKHLPQLEEERALLKA